MATRSTSKAGEKGSGSGTERAEDQPDRDTYTRLTMDRFYGDARSRRMDL